MLEQIKHTRSTARLANQRSVRTAVIGGIAAGLSKRQLVADALTSEILDGKYRVGDFLPSEPQLSQRFGISRATVRSALQTLQQLGLVSSRQGIGTRVQETRVRSRYSHSFNSAEDLLQYATTTHVRIVESERVEVSAMMAKQFGCKPREHWWRIHTVRLAPMSQTVVAYSEIYIPLIFGSVLEEISENREPIFSLIEQRFNETIVEIHQDITCITGLSEREAGYLQMEPNSSAMKITRRYIGMHGRVLEVANSIHPGDIFKYSMRVQLRHGGDPT